MGNKSRNRKISLYRIKIIDRLWVKYSNGRFGFSLQKRIWRSICGKSDGNYNTYISFVEQVGWGVNEHWLSWFDLNFTINAPVGHLPCGVGRGMVDFGIAFLSK